MSSKISKSSHYYTFESIKTREAEGEFWSARKLAYALEYSEYGIFLTLIEKAKKTCQDSHHPIEDHFIEITNRAENDSGEQCSIADIRLSRYACYLIVQNGDLKKPIAAKAQTYFSTQKLFEVNQRIRQTTKKIGDIVLVDLHEPKRSAGQLERERINRYYLEQSNLNYMNYSPL